jgi:predicted GNAT superfamily acetyltransferase
VGTDDLASAEQRADVRIRTLTDLNDLAVAQAVFDSVWPAAGGGTQVPSNLLKALVHAGGYCSAAFRGEEPIGAALGFVGRHRTDHGWHDHLHSHMAAVLAPYRDQHIGAALKQHQRAWCLEQGLDTVVWTFDPLVRRNARLNLVKLGVVVEGFEVDFYGPMDDGINSGDPTDRLFAWWRLDSQRARDAAAGRLGPIDRADLAGRDVRVIELPGDIVALRSTDPAAAAQWRIDLRAQLLDAFANDYRIIGINSDDAYLLERTP